MWIQTKVLGTGTLDRMTKTKAAKIGQSIGKLIEVEFNASLGVCCTKYLRVKVEVDVHKPLIPGFYLPRPGKDPVWVPVSEDI